MRSHADILQQITDPGVIAVVRARRADQVLPLTEALLKGGIVAVEITMSTPDAFRCIRQAVDRFGKDALIGAGSILDADAAEQAIQAGAEFVVSPVTKPELAGLARTAGRAVMLGGFTPTELQRIHELGADFAKLFPADNLGPAYIKAVRAPMPDLRIVPTGGVTLQNVADFLNAGCPAVGAGSSLLSGRILAEDDWQELARVAREFVIAAKTHPRT